MAIAGFMARPPDSFPDLSAEAENGAEFALRVTPRAQRCALDRDAGGRLRAQVTAPPEAGKANHEVQRLLAAALGIAPSRLRLIRGATARDKVFRIE
ncbi:MAG: DUF167 domain-containing protein [Pseudorhodobacter sp.]